MQTPHLLANVDGCVALKRAAEDRDRRIGDIEKGCQIHAVQEKTTAIKRSLLYAYINVDVNTKLVIVYFFASLTMNQSYCLVHNAIHEGYTILTSVTSFTDPQLANTSSVVNSCCSSRPSRRLRQRVRNLDYSCTMARRALSWLEAVPTPYSHAALSALPTMHSFT